MGILSPMSIRGPLSATPETGAYELTSSPAGLGRIRSRALLGHLGIAGVLATALVLTVAAPRTDSLLPESVRPIPEWLAGPFGRTGFGLGVAPLIGLLALMFVSYAVAARSAHRLSGRTVLMAIAAFHALVLLAPPLLSTDVFSYQAYARIGAVYSANPYLQGPHAIQLDPLYPFIDAKWVTTPTAYGPIFTLFSYLLAPLSIAASVLSYKALAAISSLVLVGFVWNGARLRGLDPARAAALVGLNPLVVLYGVGGGHNDLLMLAALAAGIYLLLAHRERSGAASIMLAAGIKLTAALYLPFALAGSGGPRTRNRRREVLVGAAVGAAIVAWLGYAAFGTGPLHMLATLQKGQSEGDWHSLAGVISTKLGQPAIGHIVGLCLAGVFIATTAWLVRRVWRGELDWIDGAAWSTVVLLLTASALLPWYVAWLLPLAALASDRRLWTVSIVMTGIVQGIQVLGYIPHAGSLGI
jgi:alpha-1,6-mannosyltransferase